MRRTLNCIYILAFVNIEKNIGIIIINFPMKNIKSVLYYMNVTINPHIFSF